MRRNMVWNGPLTIESSVNRGHWFVYLSGELVLGNVKAVEQVVDEALRESGDGMLLLSLRDLDFIDAAGAAVLTKFMKGDHGSGRFGFVAPASPSVRRTLDMRGISLPDVVWHQ